MILQNRYLSIFLTYSIALVWLINGLICKVLGFVPRHEEIVAHIIGNQYSDEFTIMIGISEIVMALWILTRYKSKINAIMQMSIVALMNIIEFILVPDLLLWGRLNALFALLFLLLVYINEFVVRQKSQSNKSM